MPFFLVWTPIPLKFWLPPAAGLYVFSSSIRKNIICQTNTFRSSHPEVFLVKRVLRRCSKFTGQHPWRSMISIKLQSNFIEITLRYGCSPVNLLHVFRTLFSKNTFRWLHLYFLTARKLLLTQWKSAWSGHYSSTDL